MQIGGLPVSLAGRRLLSVALLAGSAGLGADCGWGAV